MISLTLQKFIADGTLTSKNKTKQPFIHMNLSLVHQTTLLKIR